MIALLDEGIYHSPFEHEAPIPIQIRWLAVHLVFCHAEIDEGSGIVAEACLCQAAINQTHPAVVGQDLDGGIGSRCWMGGDRLAISQGAFKVQSMEAQDATLNLKVTNSGQVALSREGGDTAL